MKELGYSVEGKILNAADYGVPQTRRRAIVIGVRGDLPSFPAPTHIDPRKRDLLSVGLLPWVTVREAARWPPHDAVGGELAHRTEPHPAVARAIPACAARR